MDENSKKIIGIVVGVGCASICCVVAFMAFALIDPFGWFGGRDPIANALPSNTDLYFGFNLGQLVSRDAVVVIEAVMDSVPDMEFGDVQELMEALVDEIFAAYGMTFTEDIQPWIGQHIGIALTDFRLDGYGDVTEPELIIAVEVRNRNPADEFISNYLAARERDAGVGSTAYEYRGVTIHALETHATTETIARSGRILYFGFAESAIEDAIDAQKGEALSDSPGYRGLSSHFPGDRLSTIYIGERFFESYTDLMGLAGGGVDFSTLAVEGMALTIGFNNLGLQMDAFVGVDEDQITEEQEELLAASRSQGGIVAALPANTIAFFAGQGLDGVWQGIEELMSMGYGDIEYAMREIEAELGIRPDLDLFPLLDGEWAVVLLPGAGNEIEEQFGGLGAMLIVESSHEDDLEEVAEDAAVGLERSGLDVQQSTVDSGRLYEILERGVELLSYGTHDGTLIVGTSAEGLRDVMQGATSLEDDREFRAIWRSFPRGTAPVLYIDIGSLLAAVGESGYMDPDDLIWELGFDPRLLTHLAAGSGGLRRGVIRATFMIGIDTE